MTILSVCQSVAAFIGIDVPSVVMSSTVREHVELRELANTMAKRIAFQTRDWTLLKTLATITGDGAATDFARPADYRKMIKKASLWPSDTPLTPYIQIPDTDEWLGIDVQAFQPVLGAWTMIGSRIHIKPTLGNGVTVKFYYISNLIVAPAAGANKVAFTADDDSFRLDEEVLKLGMIYQWKAGKGLPYAEDMANYEEALAVDAGNDKGSTILAVGRGRGRYGEAVYAYPRTVTP